ncbi:hypothetical protein NQ318_012595 [Aromia moschata]|uniref:Cytochrome P450 n=1 Tax=Aromia moschata TaxID=1265417 RepID=A0AAV8YJ46_9CUCU|nr:hypothetical protein NQ318_012595 [Aromia moschata]
MTFLDVASSRGCCFTSGLFLPEIRLPRLLEEERCALLGAGIFFMETPGDLSKGELSFAEQFLIFYQKLKSRGVRHGGVYMFFSTVYMPIDPAIIKSILQKDFDHFINHGIYSNPEAEPLSGHLFNLENAKWRDLRAKLTPTFTSGKMKMMFQTLVTCSEGLRKILEEYSFTKDAVDIKDVVSRFSTDVIGSCAFGLDCNSLKNPDSEFRRFGNKVFALDITMKIKHLISMVMPKIVLDFVGFRMLSKDVESFFMKVIRDTIDYREKNNVYRKDFMHLMLQLKNRGHVADDASIMDTEGNDEKKQPHLTFNEFAAQCFVFFVAGFETSSTLMTFALFRLTENPDIQEKLREDILSVLKKHDDKLTYEAVMEMSYLDKVIDETLRINPPVSALPRVCNKTYRVPGTDVTIDPGTNINIPVYGIHMDPEYYPNPEVFDPERFSEENKAKRPSCTFIPFGEGPRICIGLRFGIMQAKVGLIRILKDYKVTLNQKTKTPIKLDHRSGIMAVEGGIWLNITKLNKRDP